MSHETELALVAQIIADPHHDAPRLVLADWLMQQGEPRGEFIAVSCELAGSHLTPQRRASLNTRVEELLGRHRARWLSELGAQHVHFVRGMPDELTSSWDQLAPRLDWAFAHAPIRSLVLRKVDARGLRALSFSPCLPRLEALTLEHVSPGALRALPDTAAFKHLVALSITQCRLGDDEAAWLCTLLLPKLQRLALDANHIGEVGIRRLSTSAALPCLHTLSLGANALGDASAAALAATAHVNLRRLELHRNRIGPRGATALAQSTQLEHLEFLNLDDNPLGDDGVCALACSALPRLQRLRLERTDMGRVGARALAESATLQQLTSLNPFYNRFGDAEDALLRQRFSGRLRY